MPASFLNSIFVALIWWLHKTKLILYFVQPRCQFRLSVKVPRSEICLSDLAVLKRSTGSNYLAVLNLNGKDFTNALVCPILICHFITHFLL